MPYCVVEYGGLNVHEVAAPTEEERKNALIAYADYQNAVGFRRCAREQLLDTIESVLIDKRRDDD